MGNLNKKNKPKMSNKAFKRIWTVALATVLILAVAVNVAIQIFSSYVNNYLGYGTYTIENVSKADGWDVDYNKLDYAGGDETKAAALAMAEKVQSEGIVLLKNNGTLPLGNGAAVTMLGRDAADPIFGGSGSGSVDVSTAVDAKKGLENAGFRVNETVYDVLSSYASYTMVSGMFGGMERQYDNPKANIVMDAPEASSYYVGEMPASGYTPDAVSSFAQYNDAALVFIGRGGGEGGDLARDMKGWDDNYTSGQHQLELNKDEKDTLELAKENFDKVVVIINASSAMEMGVLENDPDVDAIVWIGSPGQTGFNAVGQVLSGEVNPSGRTADIYPADFTKDPTFVNFGYYAYSNLDNAYFVQYEEGIYYGYRYYETAAEEGFVNYDEAVVYPFGYGLSYTDFSWKVAGQSLGDADGEILIDVTVTNTGSAAGKDVVELYYSAPYTKGGIEKSHVVLGDFAKTGLLAPGESETVTLQINVEDMASYDYKNAKAYVLEQGDYNLLIQTDSHNLKDGIAPITYKVASTVVYNGDNHRSSDNIPVTNQFDDVSELFTDSAVSGYITNFSRADFRGTFPKAPDNADMEANDAIIAAFQPYNASTVNAGSSAAMPNTGKKNSLALIDLRGLAYDDSKWNTLLDQLSVSDMLNVILTGAYHTEAVNSVVKPMATDLDGPAGFSSFMGNVNATAYPSAVVIASTFNKELAYELGVIIGNEGIANNVNGWYAPAMNIHRSPYAGRNFEYYSEDPVLSGKIGERCVSGAASKGVYSFIKHYALNDQETNRVNNGVSTWANEQAIREIYLRPFEITVKGASAEISYISDNNGTVSTATIGATAVMSSFNRVGGTWAGGSYPLMTTVLRDEWGFQGMVITDFNLYDYMIPDQGVMAGSDLMLTFTPMKSMSDSSSAAGVTNLRNAMHNILYTVVNSNAANGMAPGARIVYHMPTWRIVQIAVDVCLVLLLAAGVAWVVVRTRRNKENA